MLNSKSIRNYLQITVLTISKDFLLIWLCLNSSHGNFFFAHEGNIFDEIYSTVEVIIRFFPSSYYLRLRNITLQLRCYIAIV